MPYPTAPGSPTRGSRASTHPTASGGGQAQVSAAVVHKAARRNWTANGGEWNNPGDYLHAQSGPATDAWNVKEIGAANFSYAGTDTLRDGTAAGLTLRTTDGTQGYDLILDVEGRLKLAKELGATVTLNPAKVDVVAEVKKLTNDRGVDVAIEVIGHPPGVKMVGEVIRTTGPKSSWSAGTSPRIPTSCSAG